MLEANISQQTFTSETEKMVAEAAQEFAMKRISPFVMEWDEAQFFPKDVLKEAGALGFMGILIPEAYGGSGMSYH